MSSRMVEDGIQRNFAGEGTGDDEVEWFRIEIARLNVLYGDGEEVVLLYLDPSAVTWCCSLQVLWGAWKIGSLRRVGKPKMRPCGRSAWRTW